ncbi:MAG: MFS transporter [Candidatus Lokiarchaeota archaeon]|nr:MFS transporter [Candidatus Lokiarchaeota archaeon]
MSLNELSTSKGNTRVKSRNILALCIAKLIHGFGASMFNVVYQPFLLDLTNSLFITGVLVTLGSVMQFLPMPLVGKLSDRIGHKTTIIASIPLYILGLVLIFISDSNNILYLIFGIVVYFLGFTLNNMNGQFLVAENSGSSKGLMYSLIFFSFFIGSIGGNAFVIFSQSINTRVFFLIFMGILIVEGLIFTFFLSTKWKEQKTDALLNEDLHSKKEKIWLKFFKNPRMRSILIFFTLDIFIYGISLSIYNGGLNDYYHLTPVEISFIIIWMNITNMLFQIPAGRITDRLGKKKSLILSAITGLIFFIINIIASILWSNGMTFVLIPSLVVAHIIFAFSIVTFIPSEQIILTDLGKNKKAESYGVVTFIRGVAFIPTGIIGALLIENVHYLAPFIITSIGILVEIWFLFKFFRE